MQMKSTIERRKRMCRNMVFKEMPMIVVVAQRSFSKK
jgi:hypothetical protein